MPMWAAYVIAPAFLLLCSGKVIWNSETPLELALMMVGSGLLCASVLHSYIAIKRSLPKDGDRQGTCVAGGDVVAVRSETKLERSFSVEFQIDDDIDINSIPDTDSLRWDVAKPAVDAVIDALKERCFQILDEPYHFLNTEMEEWAFHILFRGWTCRIEVGWMPKRRNDNSFFLEARFHWTDLRALIQPSRVKENLVALSLEIVEALNKASRIRKIVHIRP